MNAIRCASGVDFLMDYLEGVVAADVRAALETHVAGCPKCAAFIESYRQTPRILRDVTGAALSDAQQATLIEVLRRRIQ